MDNPSIEKREEETTTKLEDFIPIYIPGVERGLIGRRNRKQRFLDILKAKPAKNWFLKFRRKQNTTQTENSPDEAATATESTTRRRFRVPFVRKFKWKSVVTYSKKWIKNPMNVALFIWFLFVAAGIIILALLMPGFLNDAIKNKDVRTRWTEITNQILNALFTIMCLYQHPRFFHHLVLLCQWLPKNAVELRMAYCKVPSIKPHDRAHIGFVIILLHVTCLSQYVLCALYWGWSSDNRPDWATYTAVGAGIAAPVIAFLWTVFSPLGKKTTTDEVVDEESTVVTRRQLSVVVTEPEWVGGLFDCCDDAAVAYTSFFCTCCVFGWNMERLGFGNMYVHIATFLLFCVAPFVVFSISVLKISDCTLKYVVGVTGCVLCFCCFMYGGYWRIQMRKKFKLPGNPFCCGYWTVTDCAQWLFCWSCSLAQEVRTGNFYEGEEDEDGSFMINLREGERDVIEPLDREGTAGGDRGRVGLVVDESVSISVGSEEVMRAPSPALIDLDEGEKKG